MGSPHLWMASSQWRGVPVDFARFLLPGTHWSMLCLANERSLVRRSCQVQTLVGWAGWALWKDGRYGAPKIGNP